jgi:hypothetical protein
MMSHYHIQAKGNKKELEEHETRTMRFAFGSSLYASKRKRKKKRLTFEVTSKLFTGNAN